MIRGTTPIDSFTLPFGTEVVDCIKLIYKQGEETILIKRTADFQMEGNTISVKLSQEETFLFTCKKSAYCVLRVVDKAGTALATDKMYFVVTDCGDDEVL